MMSRPTSSAEPKSAPCIVVTATLADSRVIRRTFNRQFTIGRADDCDFQIPDERVSRRHVQVELIDKEWWISDLDY